MECVSLCGVFGEPFAFIGTGRALVAVRCAGRVVHIRDSVLSASASHVVRRLVQDCRSEAKRRTEGATSVTLPVVAELGLFRHTSTIRQKMITEETWCRFFQTVIEIHPLRGN